MVKYCHNCGAEMKDNVKFCPKCGERAINLNPDYVREEKTAQTDFNSPNQNNGFGSSSRQGDNAYSAGHGPSNSAANDKRSSSAKSGNSNLLMKVVIAVCLILILMVLYYGLSPSIDSGDGEEVIIQNQTPHFTIDLENGTYLNGEGSSRLVESNYTTRESYEGFTLTGYEIYRIELDNGSWYEINIFKVDMDEPSEDWIYNSDLDDDGNALIYFSSKGEYYGYVISILNASDEAYNNLHFLNSLFYFNH